MFHPSFLTLRNQAIQTNLKVEEVMLSMSGTEGLAKWINDDPSLEFFLLSLLPLQRQWGSKFEARSTKPKQKLAFETRS